MTTRGVWYVSGLHSNEDASLAIAAFGAAVRGQVHAVPVTRSPLNRFGCASQM